MLYYLQVLSYFFIHYLIFPLLGIKVSKPAHLDLNDKDVLIVANHISRIDPWIIGCSFGLSDFKKIAPLRFMTANIFFQVPLLGIFLRMYGSYPAKKHPKYKYGVEGSNYYLENGYSIMMFPEGTRNPSLEWVEAKRGIERVRTKKTIIVPAKIVRRSKRSFFWTYSVIISDPIPHRDIKAQDVLNHIYTLN